MFYVYVLMEEKPSRTYVGYSADLKKRLAAHKNGCGAKTTRNGKWHLVYYEAYTSKKDAVERERKLKQYGQSKKHLFRRIEHSFDWVKISAGEAYNQSPGKRRP